MSDAAKAAGPRENVVRLRARYPEVDRMDVVHHLAYVEWFERGRTELMREAGCSYRALEASGWLFPVVDLGARYRGSARYDEIVEVRTRLEDVAGVRVHFAYRVLRPGESSPLVEGFTMHASVNRDLRPRRMPAELVGRLRAWQAGEENP